MPILETIPRVILTPADMVEGILDDGRISLTKIGNVVCAVINIHPAEALGYSTMIAVLPEGYRPVYGVVFPMTDGVDGALYTEIDPDGVFMMFSNAPANWLSATVTYFAVS